MRKSAVALAPSETGGKKTVRSAPTQKEVVQPLGQRPAKKRGAAAKLAAPASAGHRSKALAANKKAAPGDSPAKAPKGLSGSLVGKKAPAFNLLDQNGKQVSSDSLKGKRYCLYFYPKDNTPGCTNEACAFRDDQRNFLKRKVTILGVSPDSVKSHASFAQKYDLPFTLLSDPEKSLARAYGVWAMKKNYGREYMGIVRSTFLVGEDGKILREWRNVKVAGHAAEILAESAQ